MPDCNAFIEGVQKILVERNRLRPIQKRSLPIARLVSNDPEVSRAVPLDVEDPAPASANLNSRKFGGQSVRAKWNDQLCAQTVLVELIQVLLFAIVVERANDLTALKMPIGDAAQGPWLAAVWLRVLPCSTRPLKKKGRRVEGRRPQWA
jgi:hypothetical protein